MLFQLESYVYILLRWVLGLIFIWASVGKISDPGGFAEVVKNYRILPPVLVNPFALILPWVEMICGVTLIIGYLAKGSAVILDILMIVFIISIGINIIRGVDISCGCFSNSLVATKSMISYLIRDITYLMMGIWVFYFQLKQEKLLRLNDL